MSLINNIRYILITSIMLFFLILLGCSGGDGNNSTTETGSATINTYDINGGSIANLKIVVDGENIITDANGSATVTDLPLQQTINIIVEDDNFAFYEKQIVLETNDFAYEVRLDLTPVSFTARFDGSQSQILNIPNSKAEIILPANSLAFNGTLPTNDIYAKVSILDPNSNPNVMPGAYNIAENSNGDAIFMVSYGAMDIEFSDDNGNELNLLAGNQATLRIPVRTRSSQLPANIGLFFYDEINHIWLEEGIATLSVDQSYYEGQVNHFSTWNADSEEQTTTVTAAVYQIDSTNANIAVEDAQVDVTGLNYTARYTVPAATGGGGIAIVDVPNSNSSSHIIATKTVTDNNGNTQLLVGSVVASNITTDTVLPDPIILQPASSLLQAELSWIGSEDLDLHLYRLEPSINPDLPNIPHVSWKDQGSLYNAPLTALISEDIRTIGGYEQIQSHAVDYLTPGTYHLAIYNYGGFLAVDQQKTSIPSMVDQDITDDIAVEAKIHLTIDNIDYMHIVTGNEVLKANDPNGDNTYTYIVYEFTINGNGEVENMNTIGQFTNTNINYFIDQLGEVFGFVTK